MSSQPLLAMVALIEPLLAPESEIFRVLGELWPEGLPISSVRRKEHVVTFDVAGDTTAITLMPDPIPWSVLEGPCAAAWYWPEAANSLRRHVAHGVLGLLPEGGNRVAGARRLTQLASAVAATSYAAGVYWVPGRLVHEADAFITYSRQMSEDYLPLFLWIDFRIRREADGTHSLVTRGLEVFNHLEIEIHGSRKAPQALVDHAFNVAHYLLDRGPVLKDGETVGLSHDQRIPVSHRPSIRDPNKMVIRLEL